MPISAHLLNAPTSHADTDIMEKMTDKFRNLFKSERLVYSALDTTDRSKEFWWKCLSSDPVVSGLAKPSMPRPAVRADSDKSLSDVLSRGDPLLAVLICLPSSATSATKGESQPEPIGFIILTKSFPRSVSFNISFLPEHQNKGYGRESINWALDYAFEWGNVHRVTIGTAHFNTRALHLYSDMGFVQEGRQRECFYMDRRWHDLVEFSMLESEWLSLRGLVK